jgi:uncharacterized protein
MFVFLTIAVLGLAMAGMAVGVIFSNRQLRGSCGGIAVRGPDGEALTCGTCDCKLPEEILPEEPKADAA